MANPRPENEFERLIELTELDLDYSNLESHLEDLTNLAARIVGTDVSLVNLIDSYTQWSVADYGMEVGQIAREESVCQYTIMDNQSFEVSDLTKDDRFKDKEFVKNNPSLKYYFGVPLQTSAGANIGALCVLDSESKKISPEKKELMKLIGKQVVRRLEALKKITDLQGKIEELNETKRKVSHDIRNPISGIIGIAQIMKEEIENDRINELRELVNMIEQGGNSLLELVEEIMDQEESEEEQPAEDEFSTESFCQKLNELYQPQAKSKGVDLQVSTNNSSDDVFFSKRRLLQIVGNLISNSIKFTDEGGHVDVEINVTETEEDNANSLEISVEDTGVGMSQEKVDEVLAGDAQSEGGTEGEKGYGFGLSLVQHLVQKANGQMDVSSELGEGTTFRIALPV
jgi:signal transduction histidine kinase